MLTDEDFEKEVAEMTAYTARIVKKGLTKGLEEGRELEILTSVQDGDYSISRGAEKLNIPEEELIIRMEKAGLKIPINT